MESAVIHYLTLYRSLGYVLIFIGLLIEGESVLFIAAFLTHQGAFDIGDMLMVVLSSVLIGDMAWYFIGARLNETRYRWQKWLHRLAEPIDRHILTRPFHTIFLSKFTYGLHRATLVRAGMLKIAPSEFLKADFIAAPLWIGIIGGLGYWASASFLLLRHYVRSAEIGLLFVFIGFFFLLYFTSRYMRKEL